MERGFGSVGRPRIIRVPFKCIKNLFEKQFCLNTKDVRQASDVWNNSIHPVPTGAACCIHVGGPNDVFCR